MWEEIIFKKNIKIINLYSLALKMYTTNVDYFKMKWKWEILLVEFFCTHIVQFFISIVNFSNIDELCNNFILYYVKIFDVNIMKLPIVDFCTF